MIVWGCVAGFMSARADYLMAGLERNFQHGDLLVVTQAPSIAVGYNHILDVAPEADRTVLLHDDTELLDGARDAIQGTPFDVTGVVGGRGMKALSWWTASTKVGHVLMDGGPYDGEPHGPVDAVDGLLLVLSPAAARLRFDVEYQGFHGYDADICFQARQAGLTVGTAPIPHFHRTKGGFGDRGAWNAAEARFRGKWL